MTVRLPDVEQQPLSEKHLLCQNGPNLGAGILLCCQAIAQCCGPESVWARLPARHTPQSAGFLARACGPCIYGKIPHLGRGAPAFHYQSLCAHEELQYSVPITQG